MKPLHQNHIRVVALVGAMVLIFGAGLALLWAGWLGGPPLTPVNLRGAESAVPKRVADVMNVRQLTGTLLADVRFVELKGLKGYRLEELLLPERVTIEIRGNQVQLDKVWRITILGDEFAFPITSAGYTIWINSTPLGAIEGGFNLSELSAIIDDQSLLQDGATLGISPGYAGAVPGELPAKLRLDAQE